MPRELQASTPELDELSSEMYRPLLALGRGGMARVYLAERKNGGLNKLVVLKVLEPELATSSELRTAFRKEAELCAQLNHPNIVQVYDVHEAGSLPVMVMEYVEGVTLAEMLTSGDRRLPLRLQVHVLMQALQGLHYFHELRDRDGSLQEAVHRDVSPQNIIIMYEGAVKVLDFGIAKVAKGGAEATRTGIIKGKLAYMPEEQLTGDATIDRRADVYAVGVMLWEAFAGRRMWSGVEQREIAKAVFSGEIPSIRDAAPTISETWERIVNRSVAPKREDRYASAMEMLVEMEGAMAELGGAVLQRELQGFMSAQFGSLRAKRQKEVSNELQRSSEVSGPSLVQLAREQRKLMMLSNTVSGSGEVDVTKPLAGSQLKRGFLLGGIAMVLLAMGLVIGTLRTRALDARAAIPVPPPDTVTNTVNAAATPIPGSSPARNESAAAPNAVATDMPAVTSASSVPVPPVRAKQRRSSQIAHPAAPRPSVTATRRDCVPPYTVNAAGVKTYKPECF